VQLLTPKEFWNRKHKLNPPEMVTSRRDGKPVVRLCDKGKVKAKTELSVRFARKLPAVTGTGTVQLVPFHTSGPGQVLPVMLRLTSGSTVSPTT
jgi:hypothetical protein